jgi:hypothetical protein
MRTLSGLKLAIFSSPHNGGGRADRAIFKEIIPIFSPGYGRTIDLVPVAEDKREKQKAIKHHLTNIQKLFSSE